MPVRQQRFIPLRLATSNRESSEVIQRLVDGEPHIGNGVHWERRDDAFSIGPSVDLLFEVAATDSLSPVER